MARQLGSLQNILADDTQSKQPEVGMGATQVCWTDRHAFTVVSVSPKGDKAEVQRDKAVRNAQVEGTLSSEAGAPNHITFTTLR